MRRPVASRATLSCAVRAAQLGLVVRLEARLADEVVGQVALRREVRELLGGHRARVAEDLRHQRAVGVLAARLDDDLDARQLEAGLGDELGGRLSTSWAIRTRSNAEPGLPSIGGVDLGGVDGRAGRQPSDDVVALRVRAGRPAGP